ncbi:hypothetical protein VNO80_30030 [Phaseolus coccineus]|uniref:Uncharacterized protein n=1 Tax=Phaseolus coccineus TaxID=3886 RepID=A0AAN9LC17_PHACN
MTGRDPREDWEPDAAVRLDGGLHEIEWHHYRSNRRNPCASPPPPHSSENYRQRLIKNRTPSPRTRVVAVGWSELKGTLLSS